jgi:putative OPT family oligopeptide transporter
MEPGSSEPTRSDDVQLPDNAFRPLEAGETYAPLVHADARVPEVTVRSIVQGIFWSVVFSAAATFIALKFGQGIESAIPISILAVGYSALVVRVLAQRSSTLLENVNVLAIGATSGIVAGGSVFTMPAIYILGLQGRSSFFQIFLVPLLGAVLGVLFLAPFRRYFVRDLHGQLPFPEGRATTEILVAGRRGGRSAIILTYSAAVAAVFDFVGPAMHAWAEDFSTAAISFLKPFTSNVKAVVTMNTSAAVLGLGYIMGIEYASIIMAGSMVSYLVFIPLFAALGNHIPLPLTPGTEPLSAMTADAIFTTYVRDIGIGGIFAAGVLSILRMSPVIVQALRQAAGEIGRMVRGGSGKVAEASRTDLSLSMAQVLIGVVLTAGAIFAYFRWSVLASEPGAWRLAIIATAMAAVIAFLFASVSAWAIAMISMTPISGMTLTTLIVTAVALSALGLSGEQGMLQTLLIGGVVCTALSMAGSLVTQYKIAYWLGATPRRVEISNLLGAVLASAATTLVMMLLARVYGFAPSPQHPEPFPAPQASAMAAVLHGVMGTGGAPWLLYGLGAVVAIAVQMCGVSALAFALGMYLPMQLNSPLVLGACVAWLLQHSSKDKALASARHSKGTLIASGFIAGGAIIGVVTALLRYLETITDSTIIPDLVAPSAGAFGVWLGDWGNWISLVVYLALCAWVYRTARHAEPETA